MGPEWFSARRSAVIRSGSGIPMPIGIEDDLSSRHCRHSTSQGPSGRWMILGWCGTRTTDLLLLLQQPPRQGRHYLWASRGHKRWEVSAGQCSERANAQTSPGVFYPVPLWRAVSPADASCQRSMCSTRSAAAPAMPQLVAEDSWLGRRGPRGDRGSTPGHNARRDGGQPRARPWFPPPRRQFARQCRPRT